MLGMRDPGAHVPSHLFQVHSARVLAVAQPPQAIAEPAHVRFRQSTITARKKDQAQERSRLSSFQHHRLAWVQPQAPALEIRRDSIPPVLEPAAVVVKQREVVHVPEISLRPQHFLAEVVEAVQIEIGEELARQVADGQASPAFEPGEEIVAGDSRGSPVPAGWTH